MTVNAGVWIDHHKAVVVRITSEGENIREILLDRDISARSPGDARAPGGPRAQHTYTPNNFVAEDKLERKAMIRLNKYYDEVIAYLHDADEILVLGPGEAKGEFTKRIESKKHLGHVADVKTADKLTDRQVAAYVRKHFK